MHLQMCIHRHERREGKRGRGRERGRREEREGDGGRPVTEIEVKIRREM